MEIRASLAHWEGDKLIVHASTQGISNCRTDIAKDMKIPPEKVRSDLPVHGRRIREQEPVPRFRSDGRGALQTAPARR